MERSASPFVARPCDVRITQVITEQTMQVRETDATRARITDGASRDRVREGRVVDDR
jgi:hypothetical protein